MEDEDIRLGSVLSKIKNRFRAIMLTTSYVWRRRRRLLSPASAHREPIDASTPPTPPLRYFLLVAGFAGVVESSLFSSRVSAEMPPQIAPFTSILKFLPELTIYSALSSVLISAFVPWLAYRLSKQKVPFAIINRAYAYQQGGIILPFALILVVMVFFATRAGGWQPWFNYGYLLIIPVALFASYWVSLQLKDEGYSPMPMRVAAFFTAFALGLVSETGYKLSKSYRAVDDSMAPTISPRDVLVVNNHVFRWRYPERGEIVIVKRFDGSSIISRVVGLPGDIVQLRVGRVVINNETMPVEDVTNTHRQSITKLCAKRYIPGYCPYRQYRETLRDGRAYFVIDQTTDGPTDYTGNYSIPANKFFVLGDNRDDASDSRVPVNQGGLGLIARSDVLGLVYDRMAPQNSGKLDDVRRTD